MKMGKENREWKRINVNLTCKCRVTDDAKYQHVRIVDIHHKGCCLLTEKAFEKGQEVRIVVDAPIYGQIYMVGTVAWSSYSNENDAFRNGICFAIDTPVAEEMNFKLYEYCSKL